MKVRVLIYVVAAVVVGGLLGSLMLRDAGYVMIAYDNAVFETSVWFALAALVLLWVVARLLLTVMRRVLHGRADVANWAKKRRETAANTRTAQGVLHAVEGRWSDARKALTAAADHSATPIVNYLGAAQAAHQLGNADERDRLLDLAGGTASGATLAAGLTRARLLAESDEWRQCLETLESLGEDSARHPQVQAMLLACHEELGNWNAVVELAPAVAKSGARDAADVEEALQRAWCGRLQASAESLQPGNLPRPLTRKEVAGAPSSPAASFHAGADAMRHLRETWGAIPRKMKRAPAVAARYAECLHAAGDPDDAVRVLKRAIEANPDDRLIALYGEIRSGRPAEQLATAEKWLQETPDDPVLLEALVRLCLLNEEWAKAKRYIELGARTSVID